MKNKLKLIAYVLLVLFLGVCTGIIVRGTEIPFHWNVKGEIDSVGSCWNVLLLVVLEVLTFWMLAFLQSHPKYCNYPRTFNNQAKAMEIMGDILGWLNVTTTMTMLYMAVSIYVGKLSLVILFGIWAAFIVLLIFKTRRLNRC